MLNILCIPTERQGSKSNYLNIFFYIIQVISPFRLELFSEQINSSPDGGGTWQEHELTCRGEGQGSVTPQIIWSTDDDNLVRNFI